MFLLRDFSQVQAGGVAVLIYEFRMFWTAFIEGLTGYQSAILTTLQNIEKRNQFCVFHVNNFYGFD